MHLALQIPPLTWKEHGVPLSATFGSSAAIPKVFSGEDHGLGLKWRYVDLHILR